MRELIREEASRLLVTKVKDDRLRAIAITEADVSPDLKKAVIYYSVIDLTPDRQVKQEEIKRALEKSVGFFRREIGRVLDLKFVPDLVFTLDPSVEYGRHMDEVFERLERNQESIHDDEIDPKPART